MKLVNRTLRMLSLLKLAIDGTIIMTNNNIKFSSLYNDCFPVVSKRVKLTYNHYKPWITGAILKSISRKNNWYKQWLNSRKDSAIPKYKAHEKKFTGIIRVAEKIYYSNRFSQLDNDI